MKSNFNKYPVVQVRKSEEECLVGWVAISRQLNQVFEDENSRKKILVVDCYQGTCEKEILKSLLLDIHPDKIFLSKSCMLPEQEIHDLTQTDVTEDRIFGYMTRLNLDQFFDQDKIDEVKTRIANIQEGIILLFGIGASLLTDEPHVLVYVDMARWEIQLRMRRDEANNLGISNLTESFEQQYKRAYFVDWRVLDRHKKKLMPQWDFVLDTNTRNEPKMLSGSLVREGLTRAAHQPFSPVPYFDEGPWGGQWMKEVCDLDPDKKNYAWCFNCVPEENSLYLGFGNIKFELPSVNVVFYEPVALLGDPVHGRFGDEFPIRFDFLDTMGGGNLSLQVHPITEYIQEKFGLHYTQDESYYMLDAKEDAIVYLGLKEGIDGEQMMAELIKSEATGERFPDEQYIEKWPAKKHDHFLIPAGTVHCSGRNGMVLEISSTPYIFTFKLWDWGRLGLDGKPRPINIEHGKNVIQWDRNTQWIKNNLINQIRPLAVGEGWESEQTGLHEREFIETRRHWFTEPVFHYNSSSVQVFNVIQGREIIVESTTGLFEPMVFHYAETFIVPAAAGPIMISPFGESTGKKCGTIAAYVRT
ncbi:MAG: class I mannose-6-phosphate isomerase [Bacteroidetes bacterium]|nr:class I mannose-6-phosphate isomerase [Bacteroidota bacterium]